MKTLYRLRTLAWIGTVSIGALVFWLIVAWCIPSFHVETTGKQLYTIHHQDLRDDNRLYLDLFLNSIKQNNGYLMLGTSETNTLKDGNYYDFLNSDTDLSIRFSVIVFLSVGMILLTVFYR